MSETGPVSRTVRTACAYCGVGCGVLVTPDVHRVHHSTVRSECDSNYGFLLTWWDRLFGTWRAEAGAGQAGIDIGVTGWGGAAAVSLPALLAQPFRPSP